MIENRAYHGLEFLISKFNSDKICYILLPEEFEDNGAKKVEAYSEQYGCTIVLITGMNWNSDLTPWPAPGVFKNEEPFEGLARDFFKLLLNDYFHNVEQALGIKHAERYLVGVSLSGLFAVWSLWQTDTFKGIASISGSFWYDKFIEWAEKQELKGHPSKVHLSIGDKEKDTRDSRVATIEDATARVAGILKGKGLNVDCQHIPGVTHFSPIFPRIETALNSILGIMGD